MLTKLSCDTVVTSIYMCQGKIIGSLHLIVSLSVKMLILSSRHHGEMKVS